MANYILQEMADGMANKKKAPYPKMQTYTMFDYAQVIKRIHTHSPAFSEATIRGVIDTLVETVIDVLPMGHNIKIDGLGVFSLSLGFCDSPDDKEKSSYRHVNARSVNFKVDKNLLKTINRQNTFERAEPGVKRYKKLKTSPAQRLAKALEFIERNNQMTLTDYTILTGLSRSGASQELKHFTSDPASGLTTRGSHAFKVWVKR